MERCSGGKRIKIPTTQYLDRKIGISSVPLSSTRCRMVAPAMALVEIDFCWELNFFRPRRNHAADANGQQRFHKEHVSAGQCGAIDLRKYLGLVVQDLILAIRNRCNLEVH